MSFVVGSGFLVLGRVRFVSLRSKRWISLSSPPLPPPPPMVGCCSSSDLQPPDLPLLADAARISLTQREVQEFAPKIKQVVDWFGQLQAVNLDNIEPSFRADTQVNGIQREDTAEVFENKEAILAAVPSYDEPYIKVPRVLNKE